MSFKIFIKRQMRMALAVLLFFILLTSLLMTSDALQDSARFQQFYSPLLIINSLGLIILITLIGLNLQHLIRQVKLRRPGAKLSLRLVTFFILLTATPVLIVYYFSLEFLHQRLDSWLDVRVEQAMGDALELSRASLDAQMRGGLQQTAQIAEQLDGISEAMLPLRLHELRELSGALELSLIAGNGHIVAFDSNETERLLPHRPDEGLLLQFRQQSGEISGASLHIQQQSSEPHRHPAHSEYVGLKTLADRGLFIQVIARCCRQAGTTPNSYRLLYALYPVPDRLDKLASGVENATGEYRQLVYMRGPLKMSFTLVLSLVLLVSIFGAIWMAFFSAQRLVAPIRDLVEGTRAVSKGDYHKQLPISRLDELGVLVQSFNEMTRRIAQARDEARRSQDMVSAHRAYLQVLLERLSSGVLSLDGELRLRTGNAAAEQILGLPLNQLMGEDFIELCARHGSLTPLCEALEPHLRNSEARDWREQLTLFASSGRQILMCRGTRLPDGSLEDRLGGGHVIVFDDITTLVQAQRDAAWGEVARRLAHEIKNPLTPIRLSAERLRHKYLPSFPDKEAEVLDRMTHTIIQQVEALKEMVNAFSDYARPPEINPRRIDLNALVGEVLDLYRVQAGLETRFAPDLPALEADPGRLRQVLHNLLKNALEAQPVDPRIEVTTCYCQSEVLNFVELRIRDYGPGVPETLREEMFEPYVTHKSKGTGLGLAIVKKIVEEHGGVVWMENAEPGARVVIRLPTAPPEQSLPQPEKQTELA